MRIDRIQFEQQITIPGVGVPSRAIAFDDAGMGKEEWRGWQTKLSGNYIYLHNGAQWLRLPASCVVVGKGLIPGVKIGEKGKGE